MINLKQTYKGQIQDVVSKTRHSVITNGVTRALVRYLSQRQGRAPFGLARTDYVMTKKETTK